MTDIRYISTKEAAGIMGLSTRRVVGLCNAGKLEGALRKGRDWMVPEETVYAYLGTAKPKAREGLSLRPPDIKLRINVITSL